MARPIRMSYRVLTRSTTHARQRLAVLGGIAHVTPAVKEWFLPCVQSEGLRDDEGEYTMPLDPEVVAILKQLEEAGAPPVSEMTPDMAREAFKAW